MPNTPSSDKQLQALSARLDAAEKRQSTTEKRLSTVEAQLRQQSQGTIEAEAPRKPKGAA